MSVVILTVLTLQNVAQLVVELLSLLIVLRVRSHLCNLLAEWSVLHVISLAIVLGLALGLSLLFALLGLLGMVLILGATMVETPVHSSASRHGLHSLLVLFKILLPSSLLALRSTLSCLVLFGLVLTGLLLLGDSLSWDSRGGLELLVLVLLSLVLLLLIGVGIGIVLLALGVFVGLRLVGILLLVLVLLLLIVSLLGLVGVVMESLVKFAFEF